MKRIALLWLTAFAVMSAWAVKRYPYIGAIAADAQTGNIISADRENEIAHPASVTKLMTALLVLEDIAGGKYKLEDRATATTAVNYSEASWCGLKAGQTMTIDGLLYALLVNSANDAAMVLAVHSAGTWEKFVARMNARAASLGMKKTAYFNPNGLPPKRKYPWKELNRSTAADQLKLAIEIVKKHPEIFKYTSVKFKTAKDTPVIDGAGKPYPLKNHNNVMVKDKLKVFNPDGSEAVDGLKTGYIDAGGSSVVLSGRRNGKHAIVVVLGSDGEPGKNGKVIKPSAKVRDENARRLMVDALGALAW